MNTLERKFKKVSKNQRKIIYDIFKNRFLHVHPTSAFALCDKGIAKRNFDNSLSLTKLGYDFIEIILKQKGEVLSDEERNKLWNAHYTL